MKLSTEALSYANAYFRQHESGINADRHNQLQRILTTVTPDDPRIPDLTELMYEKHRLLMFAKVDSYLAAYGLFNIPLDYEDIKDISNELQDITSSQFSFVMNLEGLRDHFTPTGSRDIDNVPQYLMNRFYQAQEQAIHRLQAGRIELIAEAKKGQAQPSNNITINGPNYGGIQQAGSGNTQTTGGNNNETK